MIHSDLGPVPNPLERFPPRRITVPIDLTEDAPPALDAALRLARRWKAHLHLIHVNEPPPASLLEQAQLPRGFGEEDRFYRGLQYRVRALAGGYADVSVRIEDGLPKIVLAELAESGQPQLIVMGTHGRSGLSHLVLGSVAEAVVRCARVPAMTVQGKTAADWPRRILVPMRLADYADAALRYALLIADAFGASTTVLHAVEEGEEKTQDLLGAHLDAVLGRERSGCLARITASGQPAETVLRTVAREGFDLVVLAAHSKPFWEGLVLGTTAERVLRHCPVPVLSIPSAAVEAHEIARTCSGSAGETWP